MVEPEELVWRSVVDASPAEVVRWHARPGAFQRLTPPWEEVLVLDPGNEGAAAGERLALCIRAGPLRTRWVAEHRPLDAERGERARADGFRDVQLEGPFALWEHQHRFLAAAEGSTVEDRVRYRLPLGRLGSLVGGGLVRARLARMFAYRHRVLAEDLRRHGREGGVRAMKILVSGASGLVGSALCPFLSTGGHEVLRLVRREARRKDEVRWEPASGGIDREALEGLDGVVHLAGESIVGRWSDEKKRKIERSRVVGTRQVATALASLERKPRVLVCASAIGYYGDRGAEELDESSGPGTNFLARVCQQWEAAADPARAAGIRVVHLRSGMILSPDGGALSKMLLPFQLGVGGRVGSGEQWYSWIARDDAVHAIHYALVTDGLAGPVNGVTPAPVTNAEFTRVLGRVLGRPTVLPMPAFAARAAFGQMADELLLASARVAPRALQSSGFRFAHPELEGALRHVLGKT